MKNKCFYSQTTTKIYNMLMLNIKNKCLFNSGTVIKPVLLPWTLSSAVEQMVPCLFSATHWYIPESSRARLLILRRAPLTSTRSWEVVGERGNERGGKRENERGRLKGVERIKIFSYCTECENVFRMWKFTQDTFMFKFNCSIQLF